MDKKAKYMLIKSHIFEKRNIIFIFINLFIFLATLITVSLLYYSFTYKVATITKDTKYKTIETYKKGEDDNYITYDYTFLDNMDHITFHTDSKYNRFYTSTKIGNEIFDLTIIPLIDKKEIKKDINKHEIVCSNYLTILDEEGKIETLLNTKKVLNKNIIINDISLTLTNTYNARNNMASLDSCYVSLETYDELTKEQELENSHIIRVDSINNVDKIKQELINKGLTAIAKYEDGSSRLFVLISISIALIIIIITFTILYNYIKKKTIYRIKRYGLLNACGYKDKDIINVEVIENVIISCASFIVSLIIFIPIYLTVCVNVLYEFLYESIITYNIPLIIPIISFLFGLMLTIITTKKLLKKQLKYDISEMLEGD